MKTIINNLLFLFLGIAWMNGQEITDQTKIKDKKKIELRPNSREYGPVKRDNLHQRIERRQNKAEFLKKKAVLKQKRAMLKKKQTKVKREQIIKRRQAIMQQRRKLRK
jgi:hypothetical protein